MKIRKIAILIGVVSCFVGVFANTGETRRKAKYYFTQGALEASQNNTASAYEYFKKAYETDPSYPDAAYTYGSQRLFMQNDTLQSPIEIMRSLEMMKSYLDENPGDLYASQMYGFITTRLDTLDEAIRVYERVYGLMPSQTQLLMTLADVYMMKGEPKSAVNAIERYEKIEGKSAGVSLKKVTFLLADKDTVQAISEVNDLIAVNPRDSYSRILKGNLYELVGPPDSVLVAYKEAERISPESGAVKMSLANYYRQVGDTVMLDNMVYEALLSEDLELDDKISILGDYLQKLLDDKGEKSRGDHLFTVLKEQYPLEPDLIELSSRFSAAKGEFEEAAEEIEYAINLDVTNERYWLMLMSFLLADSRYSDIVAAYERAQNHIEPSMALKNLYAASASQLKDGKKALKIIDSLLSEINPELVDGDMETLRTLRSEMDYETLEWVSSLYCNIGDIEYKLGEIKNGFSAYDKALFFNPENTLALNNYAYFLAESDQDLEKAKEMSWKCIELSGNNPTYLDTYAWILFKLGDLTKALEYQEMAIELAKETNDDNEEYIQHLNEIKKAIGASANQ